MLDAIAQVFVQLHLRFLEEFAVALAPVCLTVILHGQGMGLAALYLRRYGRRSGQGPPAALRNILIVAVVTIMLATHFLEIIAWAAFYFFTGMLNAPGTAIDFSIGSYTTLGTGSVSLRGHWQGLEGFETMAAMLMWGWSTAVLVGVVQTIRSSDD